MESLAPLKQSPLVAMTASADVTPFKHPHLCFAIAKSSSFGFLFYLQNNCLLTMYLKEYSENNKVPF